MQPSYTSSPFSMPAPTHLHRFWVTLALATGMVQCLPAQTFETALSLRVSAALRVWAETFFQEPCIYYADLKTPGAYVMTAQKDSLPQLPGMPLYRVRLDANFYELDSGGFMTMVCKSSISPQPFELLVTQRQDGRILLLSGELPPDSAYLWAPSTLSLADYAQVRLAYLQPGPLRAKRCNTTACVFRARSALLKRRVECRIAPKDLDDFEIVRLGWRRVVLLGNKRRVK